MKSAVSEPGILESRLGTSSRPGAGPASLLAAPGKRPLRKSGNAHGRGWSLRSQDDRTRRAKPLDLGPPRGGHRRDHRAPSQSRRQAVVLKLRGTRRWSGLRDRDCAEDEQDSHGRHGRGSGRRLLRHGGIVRLREGALTRSPRPSPTVACWARLRACIRTTCWWRPAPPAAIRWPNRAESWRCIRPCRSQAAQVAPAAR